MDSPTPTQEQLLQLLNSGKINEQTYVAQLAAYQDKAQQGQAIQPIPAAAAAAAPASPPAAASAPPAVTYPSSPAMGYGVPTAGFLQSLGSQQNVSGAPTTAAAPAAAAPAAPAAGPPAGLSAVPGASGAAAASQASPINPRLLALMQQQPGVGPARPIGLSPADKKLLGEQSEEQKKRDQREADAIATAKSNADSLSLGSQTLAEDTHQAALAQIEDGKRDRERLGTIQADSKEASRRLQTELGEMVSQGVDPNKYWEDQSTPAKLGAAFAIGLGAFGAQMGHGGQNTALQVFQSAIDRNVDAQKTNLQKNLTLLKMKGDYNASDTDTAMALARAERESKQASWAIALNDSDRRAKALADGSEAKNSYLKFRTALEQQRDADTDQAAQREYQVRKNAEKPVAAAGGDMRQKILETAKQLNIDSSKAGKPEPLTDSIRRAYEMTTGSPGGAKGDYGTSPDLSKPAGGATDARTLRAKAPIEAAIKGIDDAIARAKKHPIGGEELAGLNASIAAIPEAQRPEAVGFGGSLLPTSGMLGMSQRLDETKKILKKQLEALSVPGAAAPAGTEEPEKD